MARKPRKVVSRGRVLVRDKYWSWKVWDPAIPRFPKDNGVADDKSRRIDLDANSDMPWDELNIHEFTHAYFWDLDESTVTQFAKQLAAFLAQTKLA